MRGDIPPFFSSTESNADDRSLPKRSTSREDLPAAAANRFTAALQKRNGVRNLTPAVREMSPDS
jgi:hypothetical protein